MTVTTANAKVAKALQCHLPPQAHVFCERPFAHPAGADGRLGFVRTYAGAGAEGHFCEEIARLYRSGVE